MSNSSQPQSNCLLQKYYLLQTLTDMPNDIILSINGYMSDWPNAQLDSPAEWKLNLVEKINNELPQDIILFINEFVDPTGWSI